MYRPFTRVDNCRDIDVLKKNKQEQIADIGLFIGSCKNGLRLNYNRESRDLVF